MKWQESICPASFVPKSIFWDHNLPLGVVGVVKVIYNYDNKPWFELERSDRNSAVKIDGGGVKSSILL